MIIYDFEYSLFILHYVYYKGAEPEEVVAMNSLTVNMHLLMVGIF